MHSWCCLSQHNVINQPYGALAVLGGEQRRHGQQRRLRRGVRDDGAEVEGIDKLQSQAEGGRAADWEQGCRE